jgi:hypothetical protein
MNDEEKIRYPVRTLRASDEVWTEFKRQYEASGLSWNLFLKSLNKEEPPTL